MKVKTLIPFIVILVILAGIVVWQRMNVEPVAPLATQIGLQTLTPEGLRQTSIARLEMYSGAEPEEKVVLERDGDRWTIDSLYDAPANADTVEDFLGKLLGLQGEPRASADTDARLADFSLSDAEAFHVLAYEADSEEPAMHILFGKSADFRTIFLRKADDSRVYVEATNLRREAGVSDTGADTAPKPTKWLQTELLNVDEAAITELTVAYPDKEFVLTRHEVVVEPEPAETDDDADDDVVTVEIAPEITHEWTVSRGGMGEDFKEHELSNLLARFSNLSVTNVVDPALKADWGFDPPRFSITLAKEDGEEVVLLGGRSEPGGDTYIQLKGSEPELIYQVSKINFEQLFVQGDKLFTLPEWSVDQDAVASIDVAGPTGNARLVRDEDAWRVIEPQLNLELQQTALDNLVNSATSLKPVDYADSDRDIGRFDTTVTLTLEDGTTRTLTLGQQSLHLDGRYVRFDDRAETLVLSRSDAEKLAPPVRDLFVMSLLDFDVSNVNHIHARGEGADLLITLGDELNHWTGTFNGDPIQPDLMQVENLIYTLNDFQVANFHLDADPESVTEASFINVAGKDGSTTRLRISEEKDGVFEMAISGMPYVFSVGLLHLTDIIDEVAGFADLVQPEVEAPVPPIDEGMDAETGQPPAPQTPEDAPEAPSAQLSIEPPLEQPSVLLDAPGAQPVEVEVVTE